MKCRLLSSLAFAALIAGCAQKDTVHKIRVSVADQKVTVLRQGNVVAMYDCSTSKFGLGDQRGSYRTPLGKMEVAKKIGDGAPIGMKFKNRRPTGEVVKIDAPGRDPIVTRILWLRGLERRNARAFDRGIYIHGTAEERNIGKPASYGCIRMRSRDVIALYHTVGTGARVEILPGASGVQVPEPAAKPEATQVAAATPAAAPAKPAAAKVASAKVKPAPVSATVTRSARKTAKATAPRSAAL